MSVFTEYDRLVLDSLGIQGQPNLRPRSEYEPERVLQAAAEDALVITTRVPGVYGEIVITIDGREITFAEADAIADLTISEHLVWLDAVIVPTARGRETLRRWSQYRPCVRRRRDGGDSR